MNTIVAMFANREDAAAGIDRLLTSGLTRRQVGYVDQAETDPYLRPEIEGGQVLVSAQVPDLRTELSTADTLLDSKALMVGSLVTAPQRVLAA